MKQLSISTFAAAVMLLFGGVNEVNGDPLTYKVEGETVSVVKCDKNASGELVIRSSYAEKPVTSIGRSAFSSCSRLTSVRIPDSVTSIGDRAFRYCSSLTSVTIGNSVTSIEGWTFDYCGSL
ncbi:MAG TPA: leucine-rich repeat domain-containing protein, partial [Verrucomicrobiales bacterium]|nr:leucine-rich repeat domain-containing protein [Verrucomicrobiales bacterium]